ncbi:hypothetical protein ACHHYP_11079 [Achlya hypogyna]|uniref:Uncharacterized protein n=1 Tax=Achlya hypogyna TaxID=1202772 RepID=A0A1V9YJY6_ACHHY|nr:hypothetical protein ACHHYP_11079 [Achlya hypogyna]
MHLSIPLRPQERPTAFPDGFYSVVVKEYATKYLEQLGASPTADNIALVLANMPIDKCRVAPGWRSRGCIDDVLIIDTNVAPRTPPLEPTAPPHPETPPSWVPPAERVFGTDLQKNYKVGSVVLSFNEMKRRYLYPFNQLHKVPIEYDVDGFPTTRSTAFTVAPERRVFRPSASVLQELFTPLHELTFETIRGMQEAFYRVIPFDMLDIRDSDEHRAVLGHLVCPAVLDIVGFLAHYIYWTVLRPLGDHCAVVLANEGAEYQRLCAPPTPLLSPAEIELLLVSVLQAFETIRRRVHDTVRPKTTTRSTTPVMPLLLLSLRVSLATIFRTMYPRWFDDTALRVEPTLLMVDDVVDKVLDPNQFYAHIGALEATSDAINCTKTHAFQAQKRKSHLRQSFFATSHRLQEILPKPSPGLPRRILTQHGGSSAANYAGPSVRPGPNMSLVNRIRLLHPGNLAM